MPELPATTEREPTGPQATPPETPGIASLMTLLVGVVVVACLYLAREVLIPITLAVLLSFLLAPLVNLLRRIHLGRVPSVICAVVLALGMILGLGGLIGTQLAGLASEIPAYQYTIENKIDALRNFTVGRLTTIATNLSQRIGLKAASIPTPAQQKPQNSGPQPVPVQVQPAPPSAMTLAENILEPVASPLATTVIVLLVTVFILLQREDLRDRMIRLFGSGDLHRTTGAMDDAARRLSRYFLAQLCVNAGFGCVIGFGLLVIGVPSPVLWGILAGLLRFVPYIGVPIAALFPIVLAAAVSPGWGRAIWTAALYIVCESTTGQAIEPVLYGRSTGLSPAAVMIAVIFWTWLWGPIGLILSTPLTLCLVVLGRHFKRLEFFDVLLGDRPALSPVESFYQRMLAGDPDEAEEQAEQLLREMPLSAYYDEVALPGLQLAANDAARGVLDQEQIDRIKRAIEEMITDLHDHADDARAPTGRGLTIPPVPSDRRSEESNHAVLCVAGRGPLDDAAAFMLAQLLGKHGLNARPVPHDRVGRVRIMELEPSGAAMVCLCYLELSGAPAHLRFLLRRLRQRFPTQPILVGLWSAEDVIMRDGRLRSELGADHYVSSLQQAVEVCLTAAGGAPERRRPLVEAAAELRAAP